MIMAKIIIIPNVRGLSSSMKESESYYLCPTNTVMTGRYHKDDENGQTQYEYATLRAVDENGKAVSGTITVEDVQWSSPVAESSSNFNVPSNRVIVGRQHKDDENGDTQYATASVKFNGQATFVEDIIMSNPITESAGIWFKTDGNRVMTGRRHSGDENQPTTYYSGIITTKEEPIREIKVIVSLHPDEEYFPMDPLDFIEKSRFRRHNKGDKDDGYSKIEGDFVIGSDSHADEFYNIPVSVINEFYSPDMILNRRPGDPKHNASLSEVFLQPQTEEVKGDANPTGNVAAFVYSSYYDDERDGLHKERREYWLFYGYNKVRIASHQGDWERVTLDIYEGEIVGAYLDQHGTTKYYKASELELTKSNGVQTLKVYSAKGTHATYEKVGSFNKTGVADDVTGNGKTWEITKNAKHLVVQPWVKYAGAWGEVGMFVDTTGPLGPWYKRLDFPNKSGF
ncbi:hypothetical protein B5F77_05360 [Parabacteroides sp. An277]|nr:hypothetical protein B5F77_05360 [Parabacteroides sp. An277]